MTEFKDPTEYETDDIYLAAYFMVASCTLKDRRKRGNKVLFVFTNPAGSMQEVRQAYYSGTASVKPHEYAQRLIACKSLCFE